MKKVNRKKKEKNKIKEKEWFAIITRDILIVERGMKGQKTTD